MVGNFHLVMVSGCKGIPPNTIYLTLSVHCFYNFNCVAFDMYQITNFVLSVP